MVEQISIRVNQAGHGMLNCLYTIQCITFANFY